MEEIKTDIPVTIVVDLQNLVSQAYGRRYDENGQLTTNIDPLLDIVVAALVGDLRNKIADEAIRQAKSSIATQVEQIVRETLTADFMPVDAYGARRGQKTTIREQIAAEAKEWWSKTDGYSRTTNGTKLIAQEVDKALRADLAEVIAENRATLTARMKDIAASMLAAEAVKK